MSWRFDSALKVKESTASQGLDHDKAEFEIETGSLVDRPAIMTWSAMFAGCNEDESIVIVWT